MSAKLKPYPEYRNTGVDWLPRVPMHWEVVRSKRVFREVDDRGSDGTETHLAMSQKFGLVPSADLATKHTRSASYAGAKRCLPGDIVLNRLKAHLGVFARANHRGVVSPDYTVLRSDGDVEPRYFEYTYRSTAFRGELRKSVKGIVEGFWRLYSADLGKLMVPAPPSEEQQRIADFLDAYTAQVHRLIAGKRRTIAILDEQRDQIIEAVLERQGIASAPEMMLKRALEAIVGGSTPSPNPAFWDGDVVWVTPPDISASDRLSGSRRTLTAAGLQNCAASIVPAGTVILTSRAPVGNIAIADVPVATNQGCKALVRNAKKISTEFLAMTIRRLVPLMRVLSTGTTFQEISTGRLGAMKINVPSSQKQAEILDAIKAETEPFNGAKHRVLSEIDLGSGPINFT